MAPIRVLQCVAGLDHGGYESLLMNLYRHMDTALVQFDFLSSFPGVYEPEILSRGGVIHRIPFITQKGPFAYTHALDRVLAAHPEYRIVHSHMDKFSGLVMRQARRAGVPVRIAHSHNTQNEGGLAFQLVKNYYGRMVPPNATHLFACSRAAADWMFGPMAPGVHILPNGIDPGRFAADPAARVAVRAELGLSPETLVFGHVGRFTPQKNHGLLLDIFAAIAARRPASSLLLAGTGPLQDEMRRRAEALGLGGKVQFLGARQDVPRLLQAMDCFLFPSLHEGLPVTLIEAQASGLPVLASAAITPEVCITPLVQMLSLSDAPGRWAEAALAAAGAGRQGRVAPLAAIQAAGYDIRVTAAWLQQFYLDHWQPVRT
ncbi:glycosyltransferase family 1 protein [Allofournierella sp.]|uniref:glycosyltransferase family 1 protein n=1 Tax=Allofournierella sp. TaxID=1940256 RepID=UPI003AB4D0D9